MASEQISTECDQILDKYGYNRTMADRRITENNKISQSSTMMTQHILGHTKVDKVLVGSRGEGISIFGESDTDVMFILNDVLATERLQPINVNTERKMQMSEPSDIMIDTTMNTQYDVASGSKTAFVMDKSETPAGYTLLLATDTTDNEYTQNSMVKTKTGTFLSSHDFLIANKHKFRLYEGWAKTSVQYSEQKGPSLPEILFSNDMYLKLLDFLTGQTHVSNTKDCVIALPCACPSLLNDWQTRQRSWDWPTANMIQEVVAKNVHVVPVGLKGSPNESLQWRISFTFAEVYLVQTLNNSQIKSLILLRMIAKEKLKPISSAISSYLIKNLMFWLFESIDLEAFTSMTLIERAKKGLLRLRGNISQRQLQCYMMPERNLLSDLNEIEINQLVTTLDDIVQNDFEIYSVILNAITKKGIKELADMERFYLEIEKDMTPQEIFDIEKKCSKCNSSCKQHIYCVCRIIIPYIQNNGITQLLNFVNPNEEGRLQSEISNENQSINYSQETIPLTFEAPAQIGLQSETMVTIDEQPALTFSNENISLLHPPSSSGLRVIERAGNTLVCIFQFFIGIIMFPFKCMSAAITYFRLCLTVSNVTHPRFYDSRKHASFSCKVLLMQVFVIVVGLFIKYMYFT